MYVHIHSYVIYLNMYNCCIYICIYIYLRMYVIVHIICACSTLCQVLGAANSHTVPSTCCSNILGRPLRDLVGDPMYFQGETRRNIHCCWQFTF